VKRSTTAWAEGVRSGGHVPCVRCHNRPATEVISSGAKWEDDGILDTALCGECLAFFERAYGPLSEVTA
jgi:hypothetical protein